MKHHFAYACLAAGIAVGSVLGIAAVASAQSSPTATLTPAQTKALATGIIQSGDNCSALRAIDGMDQVHASQAAHAIAAAGQSASPGSMGVVEMDGDPGNKLVTLNFVNQRTHGSNVVVFYVLFSKAHPTVDDTNSACSY
jgi:hypothetical protein